MKNVIHKILIVDDDVELLEGAVHSLKPLYEVKSSTTVSRAKSILDNFPIDVVVVDLNFEGQEEDGIDLLDFIEQSHPDVEVIVLSADQKTSRVVNAMKRCLVDFIPKDFDYAGTLKNAVALGLEKRRQRLERNSDNIFLTNSVKMKSLLRSIHKIAETNSKFSILITGETGVGKEILAKYIAKILNKNVVTANAAAISRETIESELFGHLKGSFTGAHANKAGLIEVAHNGIFFLDEIGECSLSLQAKLLRVIQEKEILPVGSTQTKKIDVRFIGATNRDLYRMVENKLFRLDLLQRINTIELKIPPLRERPEDIILYTNTFLSELAPNKMFTITACGMDALLNHSWPGNIRELKAVIERLVYLSEKKIIDANEVKKKFSDAMVDDSKIKNKRMLTYSREEVLTTLEEQSGNRTKAAAKLGVHVATLKRWLNNFGVKNYIEGRPGRPIMIKPVSEEELV